MNDSPQAIKETFLMKFRWKWDDLKHFLKINIHHRLIRTIGGVPVDRTGGYLVHARRELKGLRPDADEMDRMMAEQVLELLSVFSTHGHSGFSAPWAVNLFKALALFEPIGPLTGEDDEWTLLEYAEDLPFQNKRASHVFKGEDGRAYDINGKIFRDPNGCTFTSRDSRVFISFPYTPTKVYVNVDKDGKPL